MSDEPCIRCGATGDEQHRWIEGDCLLPHSNHSRRLLDGSYVCVWHVERHRDWLGELTELFVTLPMVLDAMTTVEDDEHSGSPKKQPEAPAPCRLEILSLINPGLNRRHVKERIADDGSTIWRSGLLGDGNLPNIPDLLDRWAQRLWHHTYNTGHDRFTLTAAAAHLAANAETMARTPFVDEWDAELAWMMRHLHRAHGIKDRMRITADQERHHAPLICPTLEQHGPDEWRECGGTLIPDREGALQLSCARCARVWTEDQLPRLGKILGGAA